MLKRLLVDIGIVALDYWVDGWSASVRIMDLLWLPVRSVFS